MVWVTTRPVAGFTPSEEMGDHGHACITNKRTQCLKNTYPRRLTLHHMNSLMLRDVPSFTGLLVCVTIPDCTTV